MRKRIISFLVSILPDCILTDLSFYIWVEQTSRDLGKEANGNNSHNG
jgi:hypothetical protein